MLSRTAPCQLRASFLNLPPSIRSVVFQTTIPRRTFSATTLRRSTWTELAIAGPNATLEAIHAVGLPWYATIPLTAILVRGLLGYYVTTLPARRREIIRRNLHPLSHARGRMKEAERSHRFHQYFFQRRSDPLFPQRLAVLGNFLLARWGYVREGHVVGKKFGAPLITWRSFFNFGMMIAFAEALRVRCGTREGLLSLLLGPLRAVEEKLFVQKKDVGQVSPEESLAHRLEVARAAREKAEMEVNVQRDVDGGETFPCSGDGAAPEAAGQMVQQSTGIQLQSLNTPTYAEFLDPTLKSEGIAWIQDLTLPDSTFMLPFGLSAVMAANILLRPKRAADDANEKATGPILSKPISTTETPSTLPTLSNTAVTGQTDIAAALAAADKVRQQSEARGPNRGFFRQLSFMQRFGLSLSIIFFFVALKLPAAVLLYILPTIATGFVQRRWMDFKYPLPVLLKPCTRPLRVKVKREFDAQ